MADAVPYQIPSETPEVLILEFTDMKIIAWNRAERKPAELFQKPLIFSLFLVCII